MYILNQRVYKTFSASISWQSKSIKPEWNNPNHNTMEQSNRATGTSMPHVLQLSAPVPVSILPQPCIPNYLEHDVPGISPMPSHNITIKTQINYLGSAKQLFKSPKYPLKISQAKPRSNWSNRGRNGVKTPKIAQKQHLPAHQAPAAARPSPPRISPAPPKTAPKRRNQPQNPRKFPKSQPNSKIN